jgi:hypothetical protein
MQEENNDALSTMCPTRKSIMDGTGSAASSAEADSLLAPPSFFLPASPAGALSVFFSFLDLPSPCFVESTAGADALTSSGCIGFACFSRFFVGSFLRSILGAFSISKVTTGKGGDIASADFRTAGQA